MDLRIAAPKMLPWLARRWKVDDGRALELWQQACREAATTLGNPETPTGEFWALARTRLLDHLDAEALSRYPASEAPWLLIGLNVMRLFAALRFSNWRFFDANPA